MKCICGNEFDKPDAVLDNEEWVDVCPACGKEILIGKWVEYKDQILEIEEETETDFICRIVDYLKPTFKLKYGETLIIGKAVLNV